MMKVLVVEDEEMIRKGIVLAVDWAALDCVVVGEASNGEEGLQAAERYAPTLIITDLKMPKMDGIEMLRRLRGGGKQRLCHHTHRLRQLRLRPKRPAPGSSGLSSQAVS